MTDEEMAKESLISYRKEPKWAGKMFMQDENICYKDGFLAGLKADRPKWHILAEEPNTLPEEGQKVRVLTEEGIIEESTLFYDTYYEELAWSNIGLLKVFAWCEIPKYTEE